MSAVRRCEFCFGSRTVLGRLGGCFAHVLRPMSELLQGLKQGFTARSRLYDRDALSVSEQEDTPYGISLPAIFSPIKVKSSTPHSLKVLTQFAECQAPNMWNPCLSLMIGQSGESSEFRGSNCEIGVTAPGILSPFTSSQPGSRHERDAHFHSHRWWRQWPLAWAWTRATSGLWSTSTCRAASSTTCR